ncbi:MAG TPA: hypothetical protein VMF30_09380, partial [Pirellulales bacterium]|nr:hypothetical protein [Pirellulales bacterium]
ALFGDWEPVADGLWLPKRIQIASYVSARNPEPQWNRPDVLMERLVEAIAVNDQVPESIFTIAYPQGTIIRDSINERAYRVEEDGATTDVTPSHT